MGLFPFFGFVFLGGLGVFFHFFCFVWGLGFFLVKNRIKLIYTLQEETQHITWYPDSNLHEGSLALYAPAKLFPVNVLDPSEEPEA